MSQQHPVNLEQLGRLIALAHEELTLEQRANMTHAALMARLRIPVGGLKSGAK